MGKTLTYEEYVKVKNLLTRIKQQLGLYDNAKEAIEQTVDEINDILNLVK